ncbi:MAG: trigger factor [Proteobacteria bacterium]|nr:trigger factor [Pseudomonadota bacterium]
MSAILETRAGLERCLKIEIPSEQVDKRFNAEVKNYMKEAKLPGFRPGHVPEKIVRQKYHDAIWKDVFSDLIQSSFSEAVKEQNIRPAARPQIKPIKVEPGHNLQYEATFEVMPEVKLQDISSVTVEKQTASLTPKDIDNVLEKLRKQHCDWAVVERTAKDGDQLKIDFTGYLDGQPFKGGEAKNFTMVLGEGRLLPDFEKGLLDAKAGKTIKIDVNFPEDYGSEQLAGKKAQFEITVHEIQEPKLPELTDDFAKKFNIKEGGIDALKVEIEKNLQKGLTEKIKNLFKKQVFDKFVEHNPIDVPAGLIQEEVFQLQANALKRMGKEPTKENISMIPADLFQEQAKRQVILGLLFEEFVKLHDLKLDPEKLRQRVEEMASAYEDPTEYIQWFYQDKNQVNYFSSVVMEEIIVDKLMEQMKVTEKQLGFDEIMAIE